jgi:type VI secretion system protein ImpH
MAMAGTVGRNDPSLSAQLAHAPYRFDIRQAVRLLEHAAPGSVPVGAGSDPRREAVAFRGSLSASFPASGIESLDTDADGGKPTMTVALLGIAGAFGPLPPPLTARLVARERARDHAARDLLDLFNHRLISLALRQARLFHPALQGAGAGSAAWLPLLALLGLATLPRDGGPDSAASRLPGVLGSLVGAAGLLNPRPVSAHALERLLAVHFGVPVAIRPLCGGWLSLAADQVTRLGRPGPALGAGAVLGARVWDQAAGIRIDVGPVGPDTLRALLPAGAWRDALGAIVRFALGDHLRAAVQVTVHPQAIPQARLGPRDDAQTGGARLGWTAWLGARPRTAPGTVRLRLHGPLPA